VHHVAEWMRSNRLQLNAAKTEILWSATSCRLHKLRQAPLRVGTDFVTPSAAVRDLEIHLDSDMSKVNFEIYIADRKATTYIGKAFSAPLC